MQKRTERRIGGQIVVQGVLAEMDSSVRWFFLQFHSNISRDKKKDSIFFSSNTSKDKIYNLEVSVLWEEGGLDMMQTRMTRQKN